MLDGGPMSAWKCRLSLSLSLRDKRLLANEQRLRLPFPRGVECLLRDCRYFSRMAVDAPIKDDYLSGRESRREHLASWRFGDAMVTLIFQ